MLPSREYGAHYSYVLSGFNVKRLALNTTLTKKVDVLQPRHRQSQQCFLIAALCKMLSTTGKLSPKVTHLRGMECNRSVAHHQVSEPG